MDNKKLKKLLDKVKYHWYCYVARGGFNKPSQRVGHLERGGIEHWTHFLQLGKEYVRLYKNKLNRLSTFLPAGMVLLLTGESRREHDRRRGLWHLVDR